MNTSRDKILRTTVLRLLRPLVRILLRNGISHGAFADMAKSVFVDVAEKEFAIPGRKQTVSRISVITGLTRKEVVRLQAEGMGDDSEMGRQYNRAARVIGGWIRDERFLDEEGNPRVLPMEGSETSFSGLVKSHSGDVPARAILDELLRVGAVERGADDEVKLLARAYIPSGGEAEKLHILGTDVAELIGTIDHNLQHADSEPFYQRKVCYDNLPEEAIPVLRELSRKKSQALLEELNAWLAEHDRDANPQAKGTGRKRAGVGVFYFEEDSFEDK